MAELASLPGTCVAPIARENGVNDNVIFKRLRIYQPCFLNQPRYVDDADMVQWGYADLYLYDAMGRQRERISAAGYRHRIRYYPWFTVSEDENDTLNEL
ncbi:hypothetical protein ACR9GP_26015, partial [Enterobacter ludwigii]